jgi:hypothetical protein
MHKDHRNVCPICGDEKIKKISTRYFCTNSHLFRTDKVIEKCKFKKLKKSTNL